MKAVSDTVQIHFIMMFNEEDKEGASKHTYTWWANLSKSTFTYAKMLVFCPVDTKSFCGHH